MQEHIGDVWRLRSWALLGVCACPCSKAVFTQSRLVVTIDGAPTSVIKAWAAVGEDGTRFFRVLAEHAVQQFGQARNQPMRTFRSFAWEVGLLENSYSVYGRVEGDACCGKSYQAV